MAVTRTTVAGLVLVAAALGTSGCSAASNGVTRSASAVVQDLPSSNPSDTATFGAAGQVGEDKVFSARLLTTGAGAGILVASVLSDLPAGDRLLSASSPLVRLQLSPSPVRLRYEHPVTLGAGTPGVRVRGLPGTPPATVPVTLRFARGGRLTLDVPVAPASG